MIALDLRRRDRADAVAAAGISGLPPPTPRPSPRPDPLGQAAAGDVPVGCIRSAFRSGIPGRDSRATPAAIAGASPIGADWIARAKVTGGGYVTVTVTVQALARVAARITAAGPRLRRQ